LSCGTLRRGFEQLVALDMAGELDAELLADVEMVGR
jgi:hypothetical protein